MMTVACVLCFWWKVKSIVFFHLNSKWWQFLYPSVPLFLMKRVFFSFIWNQNIDNFYVDNDFMYSQNIVQIRKGIEKTKKKKKLGDFFVFKWLFCWDFFLSVNLPTQFLYCSFSNFSSYVTHHSNLDIIKI